MRQIHPKMLTATATRLVTEMIPVSPFRSVLSVAAWGFQACWAVGPDPIHAGRLSLPLAASVEEFCERINAQNNGFEVQFVAVLVFCPGLVAVSTSSSENAKPLPAWILQGFGVFTKSPSETAEQDFRAQLENAVELTGERIPGVLAYATDVFCLHPSRN